MSTPRRSPWIIALTLGLALPGSGLGTGVETIPSAIIGAVDGNYVTIDGERYYTDSPDRYAGAVGLEVQGVVVANGILRSAMIVAPEGSTTLKTSTHTCLIRPGADPLDVESVISCSGEHLNEP